MPTAPFFPAYRLTVKAPRSVDATEATTLTPIGAAAHSDPFVVASIQGVTGAKPYLDLPIGKQGAIEALTKKGSVGVLRLRLLDCPLSATQPPAQVWFTAFIGDTTGKLRLRGCKSILEESLDGGATWGSGPIFTGRIGDIGLDTKLWVSLELRSIADDSAERLIFTGRPHSSISYAFRPALFPVGLPNGWASGRIAARARIQGIVALDPRVPNPPGGQIGVSVKPGQDPAIALMTKESWAPIVIGQPMALILKDLDNGGVTGLFRITRGDIDPFVLNGQADGKHVVTWFGKLTAANASDPLYLAVPAVGHNVEFYVISETPVTASNPLLIDDKHPVQIWADILDGNFSTLNSDFTARPIAVRDTTAFSNLIADTSFDTARFIITDVANAKEWIEKNLCQPFNLGYRFDGQGRVVPIDMRPGNVSVTGSIVDNDLADASTPQWRVDGSKAVFGVRCKYYVDRPIPQDNLKVRTEEFPDVSLSLIDSVESTLIVINPLASPRDAGDQLVDFDGTGIRLTQEEQAMAADGTLQPALANAKVSKLNARLLDLLPAFAGGAAVLPLSVARSSAAATCYPGTYWAVTVTTQPDPATNQRGGTRLMLCTSRTENGIRVDLEFLDVGLNATAIGPTIGTVAIAANGLDVPITLNASGDPVRVEYAITPAGTGSRPAATDALWTFLDPLVTITSTAHLVFVPTGVRIWVRARSQPMGDKGLKQPSAWVFPSGGSPAGSIDVTAITAPSGLATSNLVGNAVDLAWTNGDATKLIDAFLTTGTAPATWTEAMRQFTLPAGSASTRLVRLASSTQYTAGVRHRDPYGGVSAMNTVTFTTTGTPRTAPAPPYIYIYPPLPVPLGRRPIDPAHYV